MVVFTGFRDAVLKKRIEARGVKDNYARDVTLVVAKGSEQHLWEAHPSHGKGHQDDLVIYCYTRTRIQTNEQIIHQYA